MIGLSIIGSIISIVLGYTLIHYRNGLGSDFMHALEATIGMFQNGFSRIHDIFDIFDFRNAETVDEVGAAIVAIGVSWKYLEDANSGDDLLELDNISDDIPTNDQIIPTETIDNDASTLD